MSHSNISFKSVAGFAAIVALFSFSTTSISSSAEAREFKKGEVGSKAGAGHSWNKELTTGSGKSANKSGSGQYNKDTKSYDRSVTEYKGEERSSSTSYNAETKSLNTQSSTGANRTASYSDGSKSVHVTGANGKSGGVTTNYDSSTKSVNRTYENGSTTNTSYSNGQKTTNYSGANGKSGSNSTAYQYDREAKTLNKQYTHGGTMTTDIDPSGQVNKTYVSPSGRQVQIKGQYNQ
ncbi:MAG: hypothetical protein AUJ12_02995 [Alphaproteobacteria bacterium CG1_02_46_17]|nr:MAG: hypothetical protein AUJ12_02995 [Alphaproteobacteria bacterium CG1_02_46_17]